MFSQRQRQDLNRIVVRDLAAVPMGTISHFWLLRDVFGAHPSGPDEDRLVAAIVDLAEGLLHRTEPQ